MAIRVTGRSVTEALKGKVDPALMEVLVGLADYQSEQRQQITQVGTLLNKCVDEIGKLADIIGTFKSRLEKYAQHLPRGLAADDEC